MSGSSNAELTEWPTTVPLPFLEYEGAPLNATLSSGLEASRIQRRSRYSAVVHVLAVRWRITIEQLDELKNFFQNDLGNGAARFRLSLRFPYNSTTADWCVQFISGLELSPLQGIWEVGSQIQLLYMFPEESSSGAETPAIALGYVPFYALSDESSGAASIPFVDPLGNPYYVKAT